jgi:hypothetical protein
MDDPFSRMQDPAKRAARYQKVAEEYAELSNASSPFLRAYYQRIAEQYRMHSKDELRVLEREGAAATARSGAAYRPAPKIATIPFGGARNKPQAQGKPSCATASWVRRGRRVVHR